MSQYDYELGLRINAKNYPFYALIQAAMRQANSCNIEKLKEAFPDVWAELKAGYNALGGKLERDP